jgi:adenosylcobinamide-GDP ribazoletransferase
VAVKGFIVALQFLTRIPTPRIVADAADFAGSIRWFPAVGLVIGLIVAIATYVGGLIDPWTGALFGLLTWIAVTGALHLDGLADLADALGAAHKDRERVLAVMADPHIGSFGVVAIAMQLLAKLILLHDLSVAFQPALILIPFAARMGPLVWSYDLPPLHPGLAARFVSAVRIRDIALWSLLLAVAALFTPTLLIALVLIGAWDWWLHRTLGGVSGDCHGAGIELVETGLLLGALIGSRMS